jgi:hypothetical protein
MPKHFILIFQEPLHNFAANFKRKFQDKPIGINRVKGIDKNHLTAVNEK